MCGFPHICGNRTLWRGRNIKYMSWFKNLWQIAKSSFSNFGRNFSNFGKSVSDRFLGTGLTGAEQEANQFSHDEAQLSRDWQEYMTRNKYQMETQSMQEAGINPAMMYGGGNLVSTASSPGSAQSVTPNDLNPVDLVFSLIRFPKELDQLRANIEETKASAQEHRDLGEAALRNAGVGEGSLEVQRQQVALHEREVKIAEELKDSNISVNDEEKKRIAADTLRIQEDTKLMPARLAVAQRNASASEQQAIASLRSSMAAVQNAATNDRLADYQTDLMFAQAYVEWANKEGKDIINKYLEPRQIQELENLGKQGKLLDTQRHFLVSQQVANYVNSACNVSNAVNKWINPLSGFGNSSPVNNPSPISPDMLYGNFGTYYGD